MLCLRLRKVLRIESLHAWTYPILRVGLRIRRPYAYGYGGMKTALDHSMDAIFFTLCIRTNGDTAYYWFEILVVEERLSGRIEEY